MSLLLAQSRLPPSASIRETARDVISRSYFDVDSSRQRDGEPPILTILRWIFKPFFWLFGQLEGLPEVLRWLIVIVCVVLCIALIAHILYTLLKAIGGPSMRRLSPYGAAAKEIDPQEFEKQAEGSLADGDYINAVRLLFRAALRRLELFEKKKFRPGITNRELLRRYRTTPLADSLSRFVNTIDLKWYGQAPCEQADYILCRNEHGRICEFIRQSKPADRS